MKFEQAHRSNYSEQFPLHLLARFLCIFLPVVKGSLCKFIVKLIQKNIGGNDAYKLLRCGRRSLCFVHKRKRNPGLSKPGI